MMDVRSSKFQFKNLAGLSKKVPKKNNGWWGGRFSINRQFWDLI
jgi:hypothetical protein